MCIYILFLDRNNAGASGDNPLFYYEEINIDAMTQSFNNMRTSTPPTEPPTRMAPSPPVRTSRLRNMLVAPGRRKSTTDHDYPKRTVPLSVLIA